MTGAGNSRFFRWTIGLGLAALTLIGITLLFLLTQATKNQELYERNYGQLFAINIVVAALLLGVIAWVGIRLLLRLRHGRFGSRLLVKLAAIFALVGIAPGVLIYVVSYQFVSRSIESWFDIKVEGALDAGVSLGRASLDALANDFANKTRASSAQLTDVPNAATGLLLERIRDQLAATDVLLWSASGQLLASAGQSRFDLRPERPTAQQLRVTRTQQAMAQVEGLEDLGNGIANYEGVRVKALAVVPNATVGLLAEPRFLQATLPLPQSLVANAVAVQNANREYQERALARQGLRRMYIGTLTLSLFMAVFGAILLAVVLGNQLVRPLLVLAEGVREVAAGNLSPKAALQGHDELGGLTRAFADMTQQLADARAAVDKSMREVTAARAHLQTILDNLTAGVILLDDHGAMLSVNPGATRILRVPLEDCIGQPLETVPGLEAFGAAVQSQFDAFLSDGVSTLSTGHWQHAFELQPPQAEGPGLGVTSLVARGAGLPGNMRLLVFDDISEIVSAQRAQAWGEVARRLAHEIKNPLTPIQLSAERLQMKLTGKLPAPEEAVLAKSVKTIVEQVDAMKRLVNEFRDYARLPAAELKPLDLNALVADVLHLYGAENAAVPVVAELDPQCPPIQGDPQQLRQVIHNLLQNAQDATESMHGTTLAVQPPVRICTRWSPTSRRVRLVVEDSGAGFAEHILKRAFEPYVTTKVRGTGLGLAVVKKIADEHRARVDLRNRIADGVVQGAQVSLSFPGEPVAS
ncbi:ATP-binding protein [Ramlibacter sp. H39-3-26]|uniref:sensor histidine kinase n=1 Tax=Curvibacter soli TaxID=3031331 RepID=UPI0023D9B05F|nr:ATP-binding protein [Ramlibacter sp. H39-3-26]MDF1485914.1 ATP-binding protein [Ramlibacter sp. H39-3-26]